jgi:hypothetical protein
MRIEVAKPPNFERILEVFPLAAQAGVIFAFGDVIYNPSGVGIPRALRAHEEAHGLRQREAGVTEWWDAYLKDPAFRYIEECAAHAAELYELNARLPSHDRNERARNLMRTAIRLTAPLYGYSKGQQTIKDALKDLKRELRTIEEHRYYDI